MPSEQDDAVSAALERWQSMRETAGRSEPGVSVAPTLLDQLERERDDTPLEVSE